MKYNYIIDIKVQVSDECGVLTTSLPSRYNSYLNDYEELKEVIDSRKKCVENERLFNAYKNYSEYYEVYNLSGNKIYTGTIISKWKGILTF